MKGVGERNVSKMCSLTRGSQMCGLLTAKIRSVRGVSRQPASMGSFLTICQTCVFCSNLVDGWGCSLGLCSSNKEIVKLKILAVLDGIVVVASNSSRGSPGLNLRRCLINFHLLPQKWSVEMIWERDRKVMRAECWLCLAE